MDNKLYSGTSKSVVSKKIPFVCVCVSVIHLGCLVSPWYVFTRKDNYFFFSFHNAISFDKTNIVNFIFRYHYLVLSFMQDEETELELDIGEEELQVIY